MGAKSTSTFNVYHPVSPSLHHIKAKFPKRAISTKRPKVTHKPPQTKNRGLMLLCAVCWSLVFRACALVCKCCTVYFLVSISIHTAHCYLYESGISLSAVMKFHIHENFQSNLHLWNTSRDYLCELCMVSRGERQAREQKN